MGIRYYAYAFDAEHTDRAVADPMSFISDDPLADAWGMPHGAQIAQTDFQQSVPRAEMLYLDKAWRELQALTGPSPERETPRPSYRMFEGQVAMHDRGWTPFVRGVAPREIPAIADDLVSLLQEVRDHARVDRESRYVEDFLTRAVDFVDGVAASNRGFAYLIG